MLSGFTKKKIINKKERVKDNSKPLKQLRSNSVLLDGRLKNNILINRM
jgi:4-hydroxyphenylpyruvate dioxygenase-like putative hemolysin